MLVFHGGGSSRPLHERTDSDLWVQAVAIPLFGFLMLSVTFLGESQEPVWKLWLVRVGIASFFILLSTLAAWPCVQELRRRREIRHDESRRGVYSSRNTVASVGQQPRPGTEITARHLMWFWGIVFSLLIPAAIYRIVCHQRFVDSLAWPTCQGSIIESRLEECRLRGGRIGAQHRLRYQYEVDGNTYIGRQTRLGRTTSRASRVEDAQEKLSEYPHGGSAQVSYDPADPTDACLYAGPDREEISSYYMALAMLAVGVVGIIGLLGTVWYQLANREA